MARIVLVESYPYEAVAGGDGAYVMAVCDYLISQGHEVRGLVSDMTRGRRSPLFKSAYDLSLMKAWSVRNAFRWGPVFCSLSPGMWFRALLGPAGKPRDDAVAAHEAQTRREAAWVAQQLAAEPADAVILFFGAVGFWSALPSTARIVAAPGFFKGGSLQLVDGRAQGDIDLESATAHLSHCAGAPCIALNNVAEVKAARHLGMQNVILMNMGYPPRGDNSTAGGRRDPIVLFVGAQTGPNIEARDWLLNDIWPRVRRARPDARLRVVGRVAGTAKSNGDEGVEMVGYLADLEPEYRQAQVVVAPLRLGSHGVKTKVAEALSYGCPLVTTSVGVDVGARPDLEDAVDIADTACDFASAVSSLLTDPDLNRDRRARATAAFDRTFSYRAAYGELARYLDL